MRSSAARRSGSPRAARAARTITALGDLGAIAIAALAVLLPPTSYLAVAFCLWVLLARRRREGQKYEGLRILR